MDIDIAGLPSVSFSDWHTLPEAEAIYFVLNTDGAPLYIGSTAHLRSRWQAHKLKKTGGDLGGARIAWLACDWREALTIEAKLIAKLDPPLNVRGRKPKWLRGAIERLEQMEMEPPAPSDRA